MPDAARYKSENLAVVFQEIFTAIERLRANRQVVSDAKGFRTQIREALRAVEKEGSKRGYTAEDIRLAAFAVVAFLDESIQNSQDPAFADWHRKLLQEELFGHTNAGEMFFQYVERMLDQSDSSALVDVLEVYQLCLLLGYRGCYRVKRNAELRAVRERITEKIRRVRGGSSDLSPSWAPSAGGAAQSQSDGWIKRLTWAAVGCAALAVLLFLIYLFTLHSAVSTLASTEWAGREPVQRC